jgi:23S rRNA (pseudouridine1915-N3)-methyltransferase
MQIAVIAFGRLKTPGLRLAADYYSKLIAPYIALREIELKPLPVPEKSATSRRRIQTAEAGLLSDKLRKFLRPNGVHFLLDESGQALSTRQWADLLQTLRVQSIGVAAFCIASSLGFAPSLRSPSVGSSALPNSCLPHTPRLLSLGPQTLSHELARVVLLEQIYRSLSLLASHPYHNEG